MKKFFTLQWIIISAGVLGIVVLVVIFYANLQKVERLNRKIGDFSRQLDLIEELKKEISIQAKAIEELQAEIEIFAVEENYLTALSSPPQHPEAVDYLGDPSVDGALREKIGRVVLEFQTAEEEKRRLQREERQKARLERQVEEYANTLGLDWYQQQELGLLLEDYSQSRYEIMMKMRQGEMQRSEVRDEFRIVIEKRDEDLAQLLSPEQLEQFKQIENESRRGGRRENPATSSQPAGR